jgi:hydroxyethylthiazole kinase-like uncharacterized protein yjeF
MTARKNNIKQAKKKTYGVKQIRKIPEIPPRQKDGHKGNYGRVLVVGASIGMTGAAVLTAKAALRSGAGLVKVAVPQSALPIVASMEPCYTTMPLPEDKNGRISAKAAQMVKNEALANDITAFGPGCGVGSGPKTVLETLLRTEKLKLIIDADGLNNLAKLKDWQKIAKAQVILTPHPGEMARLWPSIFREKMPKDRTEQAVMFAEKSGCIIVLKGAGTIAANKDHYYLNTTGNPGMATGGSGDVLTGIISAICCQGLDMLNACTKAVYEHGKAGDKAAENRTEINMIASDIIENLHF